MARDPGMPLTDVQWVLGHAQLTTTQLYLTPLTEDVIAGVLAHYARRTATGAAGDAQPSSSLPAASPPALLYRPETLNTLFGKGTA